MKWLFWFLFSVKGRITRFPYWMFTLVIVVGVFGVGMLIGGILVAQSLVDATKLQSHCREMELSIEECDEYKAEQLAIQFEKDLAGGNYDDMTDEEIMDAQMGEAQGSLGGMLATIVAAILFMWMSVAIHVKRFHDMGLTGWLYLLSFIPLIGGLIVIIWCGFFKGTVGENKYGADPLEGRR